MPHPMYRAAAELAAVHEDDLSLARWIEHQRVKVRSPFVVRARWVSDR